MLSQGSSQRERVAIPRLPDRYTANKPGRVSRACDECRSRKAKCDARRPVCTNCDRVKLTCVYSEPKRDRDRTELEATRAKLDHYERVLRDISGEVDQDVAAKIKSALVYFFYCKLIVLMLTRPAAIFIAKSRFAGGWEFTQCIPAIF